MFLHNKIHDFPAQKKNTTYTDFAPTDLLISHVFFI